MATQIPDIALEITLSWLARFNRHEFFTKELYKKLPAYKKSGMEMGNEITSLKRQVAGLKGRNKQMSDRITHYKRLCYEGDEINEKMAWCAKQR